MGADRQVEGLREVLASSELAALVDHYRDVDETEEAIRAASRYAELRGQLEARRFVLPVAGVQGCGKSTLLNAVLFGKPVLPIDADETTCVPAEISYAAAPGGSAEVRFKDGRVEQVPAEEEALARFLHNEHNPGNELKVDRVVLTSDREMLRQGMVLVDLPGMGSLTTVNLETTLNYLRESVGVVFLLRTVPPLTRSESLFVASNWMRLPLALFMQNRWSDETDAEATAGHGYNASKLRKIARQYRINLDGEIEVHVINVFQAWRAVLEENSKAKAVSGFDDAVAALEALGQSWPRILESSISMTLRADIEATESTIDTDISDLEASRETVEERIRQESARFTEYRADIEARREVARARIHHFERNISTKLDSWGKDTRSTLRNAMRTKMRAGIVDGPRLSRSLRDEQAVPLDEIFADFQEECLSLVDEIRESYSEVKAWKAIQHDTTKTVDRANRAKLEALLPVVGGAAAGVGGMYGGAALGAKIGAAIGTAGGPIGNVIGGILGGVLGGVLGGYLGRKTKQEIADHRASKAKPVVDKAIADFVNGTKTDLKRQATELRDHLERGLTAWQSAQVERYERDRDERVKTLGLGIEEKQTAVRTLREDKETLARYRDMLR